ILKMPHRPNRAAPCAALWRAMRMALPSRPILAVLLVALCPAVSRPADAQRLTFEHLTGSDGLSHAHVESILQDHLGFLWIGTYGGGLNRYDGYGFTVYEHDPNDLTSLANNNVGALYEDRRGDLWIGTWLGISRFDRSRNVFQNWTTADTLTGFLGSGASAFLEDDEGKLWI